MRGVVRCSRGSAKAYHTDDGYYWTAALKKTYKDHAILCAGWFDHVMFTELSWDRDKLVVYDLQGCTQGTAIAPFARCWQSFGKTCTRLNMGCKSADMQLIRHLGKVPYARELRFGFGIVSKMERRSPACCNAVRSHCISMFIWCVMQSLLDTCLLSRLASVVIQGVPKESNTLEKFIKIE